MTELTKKIARTFSHLGACGVFGIAMNDLADETDVVVVTADLCTFSGLERFKVNHPDDLYNVGIAEQNLVGIAAGLANEGVSVFASTYASFASARALDQVRMNMAYMKIPVKLVGLTSGFSASILGPTHMAIEDIAIMRSLPNLIILSPADGIETYKAIVAAADLSQPVYIRLSGTMPNPVVYKSDYEFEVGKAIKLEDGNDAAILATGTMVYQAKKAVGVLAEKGIMCSLYDVHTIKPFDDRLLDDIVVKRPKLIVTVEEHSVIGGLGGLVAESLSEREYAPRLLRLGIEDVYDHAASYGYLLRKNRLDAEGIAETIYRQME